MTVSVEEYIRLRDNLITAEQAVDAAINRLVAAAGRLQHGAWKSIDSPMMPGISMERAARRRPGGRLPEWPTHEAIGPLMDAYYQAALAVDNAYRALPAEHKAGVKEPPQ